MTEDGKSVPMPDGGEAVTDSTAGNDLPPAKPSAAKPGAGQNSNLDAAGAIDVDAAHDRSS
jgi:hypothetical protein